MRTMLIATCALIALPGAALAQHHGGVAHGDSERRGEFRGGGDFHRGGPRDRPGERGFGARFAPGPIGHFRARDFEAWRGGYWWHGFRGGRIGWWWFAAGAWYWYASPAYPYPGYVGDYSLPGDDVGEPGGGAYYCTYPAGYYPYVRVCPSGWRVVPADGPGPP